MEENVAIFKPYPFKKNQKIRIAGSKRNGDWKVKDVTDTKVTLKCPVSKIEVVWDRFCYFVEESRTKWPQD